MSAREVRTAKTTGTGGISMATQGEMRKSTALLSYGARLAAYEARVEKLKDGYKVYSYPRESAAYQALIRQGLTGLASTLTAYKDGRHRGDVHISDITAGAERERRIITGHYAPDLFGNAGGVRFHTHWQEEDKMIRLIGAIIDVVMRGEGNDSTAGTSI